MTQRVKLHGPIFSVPKRAAAMNSMRAGIKRSVAEYAFRAVAGVLASSIRNPTPIYQTHIIIDNRQDDNWQVTDQGLAKYNYWLEGTGSRNFPATSFKGYHAFQKAYELTLSRTGHLAGVEVGKAVRRLGG
jgi:hypothetical protein